MQIIKQILTYLIGYGQGYNLGYDHENGPRRAITMVAEQQRSDINPSWTNSPWK